MCPLRFLLLVVSADLQCSVLGYLYSSISVQLIAPHNARAVLAASCLLGGVDALCAYAYEACRRSITVDSIGDWLKFLETPPTAGDGSRTPELPPPSLFGIYARRLRDDIFHFLVVLLPELLGIQTATDDDGRKQLLKTYSVVPFDMFKAAIESPTLQIGEYFNILVTDIVLTSGLMCQALIKRGSNLRRTQLNFVNKELREEVARRRRWCLLSAAALEEVLST